ncbi:hypothetical protein HaLaN_30241 [Haematococcus lacustris]|uniref:Uncharacterized protein n=1 Tax=Haematococcus lacustris TaxID=44745 RepID=A0A6A0AF48_HAELA|nr:hypothetical protein HaLaN_30241 [Haematococcus lacustris]
MGMSGHVITASDISYSPSLPDYPTASAPNITKAQILTSSGNGVSYVCHGFAFHLRQHNLHHLPVPIPDVIADR